MNYTITVEEVVPNEDYLVTYTSDAMEMVDVYRTSSPQKQILTILREAGIKGKKGRKRKVVDSITPTAASFLIGD